MSPDEPSLVRRSQVGDETAFAAIMERYHGRVYSVLLRLLNRREDALDGCQEVFWRAWQSLRQFDAERPLRPWLDRIATNYAYDRLRQRRNVQIDQGGDAALAQLADSGAGPEAGVLHDEMAAAISAAVRDLPAEYRLAIVLRHERELSYQEMATELGWPLSLVKNRLMRARRMLKERLAPVIAEGRQRDVVER